MARPTITVDELTDNHRWALLTVAEHPLRIRLGDPVQHGRYQLHTDSVTALYREHWLRTNGNGYLYNPEPGDGRTTGRTPVLDKAQRRFDSFSFPTATLYRRPQELTREERGFMEVTQAMGSTEPADLTPEWELLVIELHQRALMEPVPRNPVLARVSAAGLLAIGRHPEFGGLARLCAEARYHNGVHWSPDRHHRYTGLCTPPGAPATTWRRDITKAMHIIGERMEAEQRWHAEKAEYARRENDVYASIPYELNYYTFTYATGDNDE